MVSVGHVPSIAEVGHHAERILRCSNKGATLLMICSCGSEIRTRWISPAYAANVTTCGR